MASFARFRPSWAARLGSFARFQPSRWPIRPPLWQVASFALVAGSRGLFCHFGRWLRSRHFWVLAAYPAMLVDGLVSPSSVPRRPPGRATGSSGQMHCSVRDHIDVVDFSVENIDVSVQALMIDWMLPGEAPGCPSSLPLHVSARNRRPCCHLAWRARLLGLTVDRIAKDS